jgi:hypothetical protein
MCRPNGNESIVLLDVSNDLIESPLYRAGAAKVFTFRNYVRLRDHELNVPNYCWSSEASTSRNPRIRRMQNKSRKVPDTKPEFCHKKLTRYKDILFQQTSTTSATMKSSAPIATASAVSPLDNLSVKRSRTQWSHSPTVMAMITNNRMTNCRDVTAMLQECKASGSDDRVCQTATQYLDICMDRGD